jgi:hypothetical protein
MEQGSPPEDPHTMLEAVGFVYQETSGRWFHPESGRVISRETAAAHDSEWLAHWITGK